MRWCRVACATCRRDHEHPSGGAVAGSPRRKLHGRGPIIRALAQIRQEYAISLHGVGLSLGSMDGPDPGHLSRLKRLIEWVEPVLVSEHLSWSIDEGVYLNHLLPLPYTEETLDILCRNIEEAQSVL